MIMMMMYNFYKLTIYCLLPSYDKMYIIFNVITCFSETSKGFLNMIHVTHSEHGGVVSEP